MLDGTILPKRGLPKYSLVDYPHQARGSVVVTFLPRTVKLMTIYRLLRESRKSAEKTLKLLLDCERYFWV